jgi:hypothetical protein
VITMNILAGRRFIRKLEEGMVLKFEYKTQPSVASPDFGRISWGAPIDNAAQTHERGHFPELLHGLCKGIVQPSQPIGCPRLLLSDMVFSRAFKLQRAATFWTSGADEASASKICERIGF